MKHAFVRSLTALLASAGLALAQSGPEYLPQPRSVSSPSRDGTSDQAGNSANPVPPPGDAAPLYGPPPPIVAPVCGTQGYPFRYFIEGDYHLWWLKQNHFPALLSTLTPGANGTSTTNVLVGGNDLDRTTRNGGGLTLGGWFTDYQGFGIELGFFAMEASSKSFDVPAPSAPGAPIIVRPFFNVLTGAPGFAVVGAPGLFSGSASGATEGVQCDSGRFAGANIDFIVNICCDSNCRFDFLTGYRYLTLEDRFSMTSNVAALSTAAVLPSGNIIDNVTDRINTSSRFNGFDIGLRGQWFYERWMLKATAKVAFGASDEGTDILGLTSGITPTGVTSSVPAGFLARPSNIGTFTTEQFAVVPELNLTLSYQPCDWIRLSLGYSFLYWSSVARSGNQVDLAINTLEVPSLSLPTGFHAAPAAAQIHCTNFWAQGLNLGLEVRF